MAAPPDLATSAVMVQSSEMPKDSVKVKGYDFNEGIDYHKLLQSFKTCGFQATNLGLAIEEIQKMISKKEEGYDEEEAKKGAELNPCGRLKSNCTIFLGYTSNLISSGLRENFRFLAQHNLVDCIVSSAGGIEEDFIKCLGDTYIGDFSLRGRDLRPKGINRIGNLLVPNENYCKFEDWLMPILDQMLVEQNTEGINWTPSKMIARLGKEIDDPNSVYYWAYKLAVTVGFYLSNGAIYEDVTDRCLLALSTDFDNFRQASYVRRMNSQAVYAAHTGMIILGGGLVKHHICNANLMRNGADFCVFLNTAQEFDGCDAGARPDEAISWGKIKMTASPVKVYGEATMLFPLIVAETFARFVHSKGHEKEDQPLSKKSRNSDSHIAT
eukprot:XP_011665123.1 PREDICTED: deoxyhypusine synthase [Strongylocentrotus purpuratus]